MAQEKSARGLRKAAKKSGTETIGPAQKLSFPRPGLDSCRPHRSLSPREDRMLLDHTGLSSSGTRVLAERLVLFDPFIGLLLGRRNLRT